METPVIVSLTSIITCFVVIWYTIETHLMRKFYGKQNNEKKIPFVNYGLCLNSKNQQDNFNNKKH